MERDPEALKAQLDIEKSIAAGATSLLGEALVDDDESDRDELRQQVKTELEAAQKRIRDLEAQLKEIAVIYASPEAAGHDLAIREEPEAIVIERLVQELSAVQDGLSFVEKGDDVVARILRRPGLRSQVRTSVVATAHCIDTPDDLQALQRQNIDVYIIRALSRDDQSVVEKDQVIALMRAVWSSFEYDKPFGPPVVRALVSLAEANEESLRNQAIETLAELLLLDPQLVKETGGFRLLLSLVSDGPHDFAPHVVSSWRLLFDRPSSREHFRANVDISPVISGITDTVILYSSAQDDRTNASAHCATQLLLSWSGFFFLSAHNDVFLSSLIKAVESPSYAIKRAVVKMLLRLFAPPVSQKRRSVIGTLSVFDLRDKYLAILLVAFLDSGLMKALATLALTVKDVASRFRVAELIESIQTLAERVLPISYATRVQALPELFALATTFDTSNDRLASSDALAAVSHLDVEKRMQILRGAFGPVNASSNNVVAMGARQVSVARRQVGMQIDEAAFRDLLLESRVLDARDHSSWSLDALFALFDGPLMNPRRLDEAMHASKFMRRLLGFFHPFAMQFSVLPKNPANEQLLELGTAVITTLLNSPEGVQYLQDDKLLAQIVEALAQIDPMYDLTKHDVLFSAQRMSTTMCSGYFDMLAVLAKDQAGSKLLKHFKVWSGILRVLDRTDRDDIQRLFLNRFDFSADGFPRVALSKLLTCSSPIGRLAATQKLAELLNATTTTRRHHEQWQLRLMLNQLYDPALEVCQLSVDTLDMACATPETLEMVVQMRPSLDHLGQVGASLLTRFLSTTIGVDYLDEIGFLQREVDDWYNDRNFEYVLQVEGMLEDLLQPLREHEDRDPIDKMIPHFYGELVKTDRGCQVLAESGHLYEFTEFLEEHAMEAEDTDVLFKLKAVIWALGHVGSSSKGLPFLEEDDLINVIVAIAEDSPVYTIRGTAFFALCLVGSTIEGAESLDELGWDCVVSPLGQPKGICVPKSLDQFIRTPAWQVPETERTPSLRKPLHHLDREATAAISNLSNHILATKASRKLSSLKARKKDLFSSPFLLCRALDLLGRYHFRQATRRFVIDLFDLPLDESTCQQLAKARQSLLDDDHQVQEEHTANGDQDAPSARPRPTVKFHEAGSSDDEHEQHMSSSESSSSEDEPMPARSLEPAIKTHGFITR